MASLFSVPVVGKKRPRTCNAACYNAKHLRCVCVCEGINHQAGLERAVRNTRELMSVFLNLHQEITFSGSILQLSLDEISQPKEEI